MTRSPLGAGNKSLFYAFQADNVGWNSLWITGGTTVGTKLVKDFQSDYVAASGTLSWANGQGGAKTFTVQLVNDMTHEMQERVRMDLTEATGAAMGNKPIAYLNIDDAD